MSEKVLDLILSELQEGAKFINQNELESFADEIVSSERIYIAGAGRSGFVARGFSNRLMHLGKTVFFVGEPTTPAIQKNDLLVIISGSGETGSLCNMAKKAKGLDAKIATITIFPEATIGSLSTSIIKVPGATPKSDFEGTIQTKQPMGNAFEQLTWLICDSITMILMTKLNKNEHDMYALHANLE